MLKCSVHWICRRNILQLYWVLMNYLKLYLWQCHDGWIGKGDKHTAHRQWCFLCYTHLSSDILQSSSSFISSYIITFTFDKLDWTLLVWISVISKALAFTACLFFFCILNLYFKLRVLGISNMLTLHRIFLQLY